MRINNLIKILTFSDVVILAGWGLINPVFAIFVTQQVKGGNIELLGLSGAIYWVIRSSLQLPFARFIDGKKGEIDDFAVMTIGTVLTSFMPFVYIFVNQGWQILVVQGFLGLGAAMTFPGWMAIFTRHIDKNIEAEEWGLYNAMIGFGTALTAAISGFAIEKLGFRFVFLIVGVLSTFGASFLYFVYQDLRRAERKHGI